MQMFPHFQKHFAVILQLVEGNEEVGSLKITPLPLESARALIEQTVREIHKIETAIEPRFQEHFVNASNIPNAVEPFPILRSIVTLPEATFNTGDSGGEGGRRRRGRRG